MANKNTQSHLYAAWDKLVCRSEKHIENLACSLVGYEKHVVFNRLVQLIEEKGFGPFSRMCAQNSDQVDQLFYPSGTHIQVEGLVISTVTGQIRLTFKFFLRSMLEFTYHWISILLSILSGFKVHSKQSIKPAVLFFGITENEVFCRGDIEIFLRFCRRGPIEPLRKASRIIVAAGSNKSTSDTIIDFNFFPIALLLREQPLSKWSRFKLVMSHMACLVSFLVNVIRHPIFCLLKKDIAETAAVRALDRIGVIESVITTNSCFSFQPLWVRSPLENRKFRVHKVHYSQNSKPVVYKNDSFYANYPAHRHVKVDEHWVWTEGFKSYWKSVGHSGKTNVVGPILFYLPERSLPPKKNTIQIAVFDVTPVYAHIAKDLGAIRFYYETSTMMRFIQEIINVSQVLENKLNRSFRVLLKNKRRVKSGFHDEVYIDFIKEAVCKYGQFEYIAFDENLYSVIDRCDMSVSIPYTSTAYVASYLKKPAIYFDPTSELMPSHEPVPGIIRFASGYNELEQAIFDCLAVRES